MADHTCGGCRGLGSHRRWCVESVGPVASQRGLQSEKAEALGDAVGSNNPAAANYLYAASALLRQDAQELAAAYQARA